MNAALATLGTSTDTAGMLGALAAADGMFVTADLLGRITGAGGPALSLLTTDGRPLEGRPLPAALRGAPALEEALREALDEQVSAVRCTIGETDFDLYAAPLRDDGGDVVGAVAFAAGAPAVPAAANGPARCGEALHGRDTVEAALTSAVRAARRGHASALLHVRVGDLRLVNRAFGRAAGDALLEDSADALRELFPHPTVLCRIGTADFAIVLEHLRGDPAAAVAQASEAAIARLESLVALDGADVRRTARAAAALVLTGDETPEELLQLADDEVSEQGAGRSAIAAPDTPRRARAGEDLNIIARLPGAAERDELRLLYQPIYDLQHDRLYGVEALLRWTDARLGPVSPGRFIPISEQSGAVHELGGWVIDELCRHAAGWDLEGRDFQMHFNASAAELQRPGYGREVLRRIARQGLEPRRFVLEVTESTAVLDPHRTFEVLAELRAAGMQVAIDDFGAGHSSLTRLKDLPADILKIDRGIIAHLGTSKEARAIVTAAVSLAGELGMAVVAEGIETDEQRSAVVRAGCSYVQGFMFGRPSETVPRR